MGKGGDAATKSRGMQLADKVQKITWSEVKKHVREIFFSIACIFVFPQPHLNQLLSL